MAQGRLAEVLGPAALGTDRFMRTLGIARTAQSIAEKLDAETRALVDAYAAGINAALTQRTGPLPPEFLLTRAPAPAPWTAADTVGWSLLMALDLSQTWRNELARLRLATQLNVAEINDFRPPYPGDTPLVTTDYVELYRTMGLFSAKSATTSALTIPPLVHVLGTGDGLGSNNWVVAGSRSASGKPIVANDPHLGLTAPSVWYFARLSAPGLEAFGATFPGVPYVVLGRNARVAWGATNTGPDVQDFYIERLHPERADEYQTPDGFAKFDIREETIHVRGEDSVIHRVRTTRHGPVLSDALALPATGATRTRAASPLPSLAVGYVLALRWTALEPEDHTLRALRNMNRAENAAQFVDALRDWTIVQQSFVFADDAGRIGFVAPGRIPLRNAGNPLKGLVPAPGWEAKYDWTGWLPFEQLPRVLDPPSGRIVTANHRVTPEGYPHFITAEWFLPYRAARIEQLLDAPAQHTLARMRAIQGDVVSLAAQDMVAALKALDPQPQSPAGQLARDRIFAWDGSMRLDAAEPALFHAWLRELRERIFADDLGPLAADFVSGSELTLATLRVLRGEAKSRDWCDESASPQKVETCSELAAAALDAAVAGLTADSGRDVLGLRWGDMRRAVLEHRPLSSVPVVSRWVELSVPYPGDSFTVNVGQLSLRPAAPFNTRHAASFRAVYDLGSPSAGEWMFATGQSGHPLADDYGTLLSDWQAVRAAPVVWDVPKGDIEGRRVLRLKPRTP